MAKAKGKDWVICLKCGEEYNRFARTTHKCDSRILAQLERDRKADEVVRQQEKN